MAADWIFGGAMISRCSAAQLVSLLSNTRDSLLSVYSQFTAALTFDDRIMALPALSLLLTNAILDHYQQVMATWLLYAEFSRCPITGNPFLGTFISIANSQQANRHSPCLYDLFPAIFKDELLDVLGSRTVVQVMRGEFPRTAGLPPDVVLSDECLICPVLVLEDETESRSSLDEILIELFQMDLTSFECPFFRPETKISEPFPGELAGGFVSALPVPFLFDSGAAAATREDAHQLMVQATTRKLTDAEADQTVMAMNRFPSLVEASRLTDAQIISLIQNNARLAKEFVSRLADANPGACRFVTRLGISVASVEVANLLISSGRMPDDVVEEFVSNSVELINATKERTIKTMRARLFCRFMTVVKPNALHFHQDLMIALRSFCIDMVGIGCVEAKGMFELL
jgi:hypothetical protein